jgi:hypothetical protein
MKSTRTRVTGEVVACAAGFVLVDVELSKKVSASEIASTLLPRLARALSKPGISRDAVLKGQTRNVCSYSIDPSDTSRVVRVAADGRRTVGRHLPGCRSGR